MKASSIRDREIVDSLLRHHANVNGADELERSAVHYALIDTYRSMVGTRVVTDTRVTTDTPVSGTPMKVGYTWNRIFVRIF